MKIGIVTQPLHTNYGGLLQNYALQQVLLAMGHQVHTLHKSHLGLFDSRWNIVLPWRIRQTIKKHLGREYSPSYKEIKTIRQHCINFVKQNISTTKVYRNEKELLAIVKKHKFDAYIAGSDQVWRPCYSKNIYNDFLDFCQDEQSIKRIAFSASFGVSKWEFNKEQTRRCARLAKLFDAISVREDSGISLCNTHLGVEATHVADPTLLLEKEDYIKLAEKNHEPVSDGNLFCYILDNTPAIEKAISDIEQKEALKSFQVKAKKTKYLFSKSENISDHVIPSPTKWLRAFMDAKMVFTDSFHGCVFSIIFNKPFWVIGNKDRGNARFDSLLKMFNLENRMISIDEINKINLAQPIDWERVNATKREWKEKSIKFLKKNLEA